MAKKNVYFFGGGKAEGRADMKNLLGGKGITSSKNFATVQSGS